MSSILINTAPQHKFLYTVKKYDDSAFHLPFHRHERYELTYIIRGKGTRIIGDNMKEYEDGDIVLMAPHTAHHWQSAWFEDSSVSAITVFFSEEFPSADFKHLPEFNNIFELLETAKFGIELKGSLRQKVATLLTDLKDEYSVVQIMNIVNILDLISKSDEFNILMDRGFAVPKNQNWERISEIVTYIRTNISQKITNQNIADVAYMHVGSVNRFFKQATGFTIIEYINLMRIGMACELLNGSHKKTSEIAFECGFNNLSNFNRIFKKVKKVTPNEYRKRFS